jgi:transcriptional regulator with GAF, ATPase, and Fis domain
VALNCAAVPESLVQSELFGHEKGAFTGASHRQSGQLASADGGTLFVDEIAELSFSVQAKLLRTLQDREVRRLGSSQTTKVDVRVIAATNEDLRMEVAQGRFRADLFFRLNVVTLALPALRDRPRDIQLLAEHFLHCAVHEQGRGPSGIAPEALAILRRYFWPGNVRELQHAIEQGCLWCDDPVLRPQHLPPLDWQEALMNDCRRATVVGRRSMKNAIEEFEREMIMQALTTRGYVQTQAAAFLGITRRQLKYRLDALGIHVPKNIA